LEYAANTKENRGAVISTCQSSLSHQRDTIETIQNDLQLVDIVATVRALQKASVGKEWVKPSDTHHIYWPERLYPKQTIYRAFRELPVHKVMLPRDFHDFLHRTSEPPNLPEEDIMQYHVTSHDSAKVMFESAQIIIQRQREIDRLLGKKPGKEKLEGGVRSRKYAISRNKMRFESAREIFSTIPCEARAVHVDVEANLRVVARQLGCFALKPTRHFQDLLKV
jgi:hypothetical protein